MGQLLLNGCLKMKINFNNLPNVFVFINETLFGYDTIITDNENNNKNYNLSLPLFTLKNNRDNTVSL